jgi:hypothetical protein
MKKTKKDDPNPTKTENNPEREADKAHLPVFLEMAMTLSRLLVLVLGTATVGFSLAAGCDLFTAVFRGGVALLCGGLYVWLVNWILAQRSMKVLQLQLRQADSGGEDVYFLDRDA